MLDSFDLFRSGRLFRGDCCEGMEALLGEGLSVDLVVTSPPYDDLRTYDGYSFDFPRTASLLTSLLCPGGVIVWVVSDMISKGSESGTSFRQALHFKDECGLNLHDTMVWEKVGVNHPDRTRYYPVFEFMFVFSKGSPKKFNPIVDRKNVCVGNFHGGSYRLRNGEIKEKTSRKIRDRGVRTNIWKIQGGEGHFKKDIGHPAIFPVKLAADHIKSWSNPGDVVLDPFMGSGTTAVAAEKTDRFWLGCECSLQYCDLVRRRVLKAESGFGVHRQKTKDTAKRSLLGL